MAFVPLSGQAVFDAQGNLIEGALLYAYDAGTTSPRDLFPTSALDPAKVLPTPVVASGAVLPVMFAGVGDYDLHIYDPTLALIRVVAGLPGDAATDTPSGTFDPNAQLQTGDVITRHGTGSRVGFVRANGMTIGSAATSASERANADCHALFVFLYVNDASLLVSGGRSLAGAEADWQANKTLTLPDDRGRAELACADMGNTDVTASRLSGGLLPNGAVLGATGGEAAHALVTAEEGSTVTVTTSGGTLVIGAGGGAAHNTLPPAIFRTRYIKL